MRRFIDIGANLTDPQFRGIYRGSRKHADDLAAVIARAKQANVTHILVTGSNLEESRSALDMCRADPRFLFSTVGVHPCHAGDVPSDAAGRARYLRELEAVAHEGVAQGHIKAFGEIGLDYDRLHFASAEQQRDVFEVQLALAQRLGLPLFLHSRNAAPDFRRILAPYVARGLRGVVHSFTGTPAELHDLLSLGLYIGINGCSLKTAENLDAVKQLPLARLMLETDGPWCEIRRTHASHQYTTPLPHEFAKKPEKWRPGQMVRGRCEPCAIANVAEVVAAVQGVPQQDVVEHAYGNAMDVFAFDQSPQR